MAKGKKHFLENITNTDIENIGLKILKDNEGQEGRYYGEEASSYVQAVDPDSILDDGSFICHYEIIHIGDDSDKEHKDNKVYVEIHFENDKKSKYMKEIVENLAKQNESLLELIKWRPYCPGIRLIENGYDPDIKNKNEILKNLKRLKELTLETVLSNYQFCFTDSEKERTLGFTFQKQTGDRAAKQRYLSKFCRDSMELEVRHEKIKSNLISKFKDKSFSKEYGIKDWSEENPVNGNNYIDVVAKTNDGMIFFEIKTVPSARLCIRQAFGQLMEYAYFPNIEGRVNKLIVVGTGKKDKNVKEYISFLNKKFSLSFDYLQISID